MLNKSTGVVFPYNEKQIEDKNNQHLAECTKDGLPVSAKKKPSAPVVVEPVVPVEEPAAPVAEETPVVVVEDPPVAEPPKVVKMPDTPLEELPRAELSDLAKVMEINVPAKAKASDIIALIRENQAAAAEAAAESE